MEMTSFYYLQGNIINYDSLLLVSRNDRPLLHHPGNFTR